MSSSDTYVAFVVDRVDHSRDVGDGVAVCWPTLLRASSGRWGRSLEPVAARPSQRHRDVCRRGYLRFGDGHPSPFPKPQVFGCAARALGYVDRPGCGLLELMVGDPVGELDLERRQR